MDDDKQSAQEIMGRTSLTLSFLLVLSLLVQPAKADVIDFLFGAGKFGRKAEATADCRNVFQRIADHRRASKDQTWKTRVVSERAPQFLNDLDYLEENKLANGLLGVVDTRFMKDFDTRFYYTSTAKPRPDGSIPMVDPDAKALVIYFHGSGTEKASGATFSGKMNALARLGYSSLSFDLPHHMDGSRNPALNDAKAFADYIHKIVESVRVPGQPVILAGHSFGPDVISEYITRYPHSVDSAVLISPANLDAVSAKWYEEKTSKMDFGDTKANEAGGAWAARVTTGNTWNDPKAHGRVDPTVANPNLKVYVVSGDREEYFPGELGPDGKPTAKPRDYDVAAAYKPLFKNAQVTIEPGVGHYIFQHQDAQGQDVVLRSILKANNESLLDEKEIKKAVTQRIAATRTTVDQVANRFSKDIFFRDWLNIEAKKQGTTGIELVRKMLSDDDKKGAQKLINTFNAIDKQRIDAINANIKNTASWAPAFYNENKALIDQLGTKGYDPLQIHTRYLNFLKAQDKDTIAANAVANSQVYIIPEKPQAGPRPEGQQGQKPAKAQKKTGDQKQQTAQTESKVQQGDSPETHLSPNPLRQQGDGEIPSRQQGTNPRPVRQQGEDDAPEVEQQSAFYFWQNHSNNLFAVNDFR